MKYHVFACPALIWRSVLIPLSFFAFFIGVLALSSAWNWIPFFSVISIIICLIVYVILQNAYCRIVLDEEGVRNKYLCLKWEELNDCTLSSVRLNEWKLWPTVELDSVICFGPPSPYSFLWQNKKTHIFIALNAKNLKIMHVLANGKSRAVTQLWDRYSETLKFAQETPKL